MANADIIKRISALLSSYEGGYISATQFESKLEHHVSALEMLGSVEIGESRDLSSRLVKASFTEPDVPGEDPLLVVNEIKTWISSLPL